MNHSFNNSFDSFVENFFPRNDQLALNSNGSLDPVFESHLTERNNIVSLFKLVIKELFKHRSKTTLTNECRVFFDHLFVCLEKCFQHGLKQRKQMFGGKVDIWNVIEMVEKRSPDAHDVTESARHLPKIRSSIGRSRAWFRLAMMKKKLPEFFQLFLDCRDSILRDYYELYAFVFSEDANIIAGLLLGLNAFEYNVYIKDESFDLYDPVIDLKYYLKEISHDTFSIDSGVQNGENGIEELQSKVLADQNVYIEEVNERLKNTIKDLEAKLEQLTEAQTAKNNQDCVDKSNKSLMDLGSLLATKEKQLLEEAKIRAELEKRVEAEIKLRDEAETARNLLESDVQEKQDTIITLRSQLDEVKEINIQLFKKMQEKDSDVSAKNKEISSRDSKISHLKKEIKQLEKKQDQLKESISDKTVLESYQKMIDEQQEQLKQLHSKIEDFQMQKSMNLHLKESYNLLKKKYDENELALEEIGKQLQDTKLEMETLREYNGHLREAAWAKDSDVNNCKQCEREFTISRRKHHCRNCGEIFCGNCSNNEMPLPSSKKPVRVCDTCHAFLLDRYSHTN